MNRRKKKSRSNLPLTEREKAILIGKTRSKFESTSPVLSVSVTEKDYKNEKFSGIITKNGVNVSCQFFPFNNSQTKKIVSCRFQIEAQEANRLRLTQKEVDWLGKEAARQILEEADYLLVDLS